MSILGLLLAGAPGVARARSAHLEGKREGEERRAALLQALLERKEKRERGELDDKYRRAQTDKLEREAREPQAPTRGTPEYEAALRREEEIRGRARARHRAPRDGTTPQNRARQDLASVERQVDDTRSDLARAEREVPERPSMFLTPGDSTAFERSHGEATGRANRLRQRADSLGGVRDSLAGVVQGRSRRGRDFQNVQSGSSSGPAPARPKQQRIPSDSLLMELDRRYKSDDAKIRAELRRQGFSDQ